MYQDKKWKYHDIGSINYKDDELDTTNTDTTYFYLVVLLFVLIIIDYSSKFTLFGWALIALYLFNKLIFNKNFILYDILYSYVLKIKLITIESNLSPFRPTSTELERIVYGHNKNYTNKEQLDIDFKNSIVLFWIRKNKRMYKELLSKKTLPYLSLIILLYSLKERPFKLLSVIGAYFLAIGLLYMIFMLFFIEQIKCNYHIDSATVSFITILFFIIWYAMTIYSAFQILNIDKYIEVINKYTRENNYSKDSFRKAKRYESILKTFDRDSAIYLYDYPLDEYSEINSCYLKKELIRSKKYVEKNIGALITIVISIILVVFVEITANGIFQNCNWNKKTPDTNHIIGASKCQK